VIENKFANKAVEYDEAGLHTVYKSIFDSRSLDSVLHHEFDKAIYMKNWSIHNVKYEYLLVLGQKQKKNQTCEATYQWGAL
jgi:hypothetical protein